jgi:hypothetical protein
MKLQVEWSSPIALRAIREHVGYEVDLTKVPDRAGVYIFGRQWGTGIRYFLSEGHDLVNKQGTRIRRHELASTGRHTKKLFPKLIYLEKTRGK